MSQVIMVQPSLRVSMEYQDSDGVVTQREIMLNEVELGDNDRLYLRGYCFLREEPRTFRAGRIRSIADNNGPPTDVVDFLKRHKLVNFDGTLPQLPAKSHQAVGSASSDQDTLATVMGMTLIIAILGAVAYFIYEFGWLGSIGLIFLAIFIFAFK